MVVTKEDHMCAQSGGALDHGQYSPAEIHKYEVIYGRNFISPGGEATARAILGLAVFEPNMTVLDVGCGLGGAAFLMARVFGARVRGIDISRNMLRVAQERLEEAGLAHAVTLEHADILRYAPPISYDLVHSRDVFLHIQDKAGLFGAIKRCLRPGGQLLFSDYMCRSGARSADFEAYVAGRGYDLQSLDQYRALLTQAGFEVLLAQDRTAEFVDILRRELERLGESQLDTADRAALEQSWRAKLRRARAGEQRWGVCLARKPA
jgi:phosphoethanolamine N-methyltransferase